MVGGHSVLQSHFLVFIELAVPSVKAAFQHKQKKYAKAHCILVNSTVIC